MKIGIAISLYNKFDELALLVDIIRHNWKDKYIISVCSNCPGAEEEIKKLKLDIDIFTPGQDIPFSKSLSKFQQRVNMTCRVFDCIKKSCLGAQKLDCDYIMHVHTDAWPLKEEGLKKIINLLEERKKVMALRGLGFTRYGFETPIGHVDDMFFVYNGKYAKKVGLFEINPLAMLPARQSIHGILATIAVGKVGLDKVYHYDNLLNNKYWDGRIHNPKPIGENPVVFNEEFGLLHVNRGSLTGDYSQQIQAMYLNEYGLNKGAYIHDFLQKYLVDKKQLFNELKRLELKINRKIRLNGFPIVSWSQFERDISRKQIYLNLPFSKKVKCWGITMFSLMWNNTFKKHLGLELNLTHEVWPESLDSFYTRNLNPHDFPKEMIWYENKIDKHKVDRLAYKGINQI
ncbi:MAG: hypothetical protein AABX04_08285 [Nanoarchaeota archaeon]